MARRPSRPSASTPATPTAPAAPSPPPAPPGSLRAWRSKPRLAAPGGTSNRPSPTPPAWAAGTGRLATAGRWADDLEPRPSRSAGDDPARSAQPDARHDGRRSAGLARLADLLGRDLPEGPQPPNRARSRLRPHLLRSRLPRRL